MQVGASTLVHFSEVSFIGGVQSKSLIFVLYDTLIYFLRLVIYDQGQKTHVLTISQCLDVYMHIY